MPKAPERYSAEQLKQKHLSCKIKARDRAIEFSDDFYEDGGILFCSTCQLSVDFIRRQTILEHIKSQKHISRKANKQPGKLLSLMFSVATNTNSA